MTEVKPTEEELGDWRIASVTWTTAPIEPTSGGMPGYEAGSVVRHVSSVKLENGGPSIGFTIPSAAAMALNIAAQARERAKKDLHAFAWQEVMGPDGPGYTVKDTETPKFYDFIEQCLMVTVFSYQAIEMFCNNSISRIGVGPIKVKRKKKRLVLSRADAERQLSTSEKLAQVLPKLFELPTPKGKKVWEPYRTLQRVRDDAVHLKTKDQVPSENESLYYQFLNGKFAGYPRAAADMIGFFETPRWLKYWYELHEDGA